jgi:hypothetical protein
LHPDNNRKRIYYVIVARRGEGAYPFCWEIQRRQKAMGIKVSGCGYRSYRAAQDAGKKALNNFLNELSKEAAEPVCTENLIRVDDVMESPKLME